MQLLIGFFILYIIVVIVMKLQDIRLDKLIEENYENPLDIIYERAMKDLETKKDAPVDICFSDQFMSASDKRDYLRSDYWKSLKKKVHERDITCQDCGWPFDLEVHHITYQRLGKELLQDLVLLCRDCHQDIHDKKGYDRTTLYKTNTRNIQC